MPVDVAYYDTQPTPSGQALYSLSFEPGHPFKDRLNCDSVSRRFNTDEHKLCLKWASATVRCMRSTVVIY
jgi:hypothetical protein